VTFHVSRNLPLRDACSTLSPGRTHARRRHAEPNPDPGEEYEHVNTALFSVVDPIDNQFRDPSTWPTPIPRPPALHPPGRLEDRPPNHLEKAIVGLTIARFGTQPVQWRFRRRSAKRKRCFEASWGMRSPRVTSSQLRRNCTTPVVDVSCDSKQ